jgi:glycosyltransferase involved in cell wall biosynthesis
LREENIFIWRDLMTAENKISIILPIYNVEKYLKQALDSCLEQTLDGIEIICIDDCSTDNSKEILKEYTNRYSNIKTIYLDKNSGQGYARNRGLEIANGNYIMFLDPDDWLEKDACELAYNQITQNNNDFVMFTYKRCNDITNEITINKTYLKAFQELKDSPSINLSEMDTPFVKASFVWVQIYNKEFLNVNNISYNENLRIGEDLSFYFRAILYSKSVSILDKPLYNYRLHLSSTTQTKQNFWQNTFNCRKEIYDLYKQSASESLLLSFIAYCIKSIHHWYRQFSKKDSSIAKDYYKEMRKFFTELNNEHDIKQIEKYINYKYFKKIIKYNYFFFSLLEKIKFLSQQIFSLKKVKKDGIRNKYIILLGIKILISTTPLDEN